MRRPHHLDLKTGMYKGRQVLKAKKSPDRTTGGTLRPRRPPHSANAFRKTVLTGKGPRPGPHPLVLWSFSVLLIPLAVYNIIVFLMPGVSFTNPVVKLTWIRARNGR